MVVRHTLAGDTDLDFDVDLSDLGNLATNFGKTSGGLWIEGNFDYDDDVDLPDLGTLSTSFGISLGGEARSAAAMSFSRRRVRGILI